MSNLSHPLRRYILLLGLLMSLLLTGLSIKQAIAQPSEAPQTAETSPIADCAPIAENEQQSKGNQQPLEGKQFSNPNTQTEMYPSKVIVSDEDNKHTIIKVYDLPKDTSPSAIPREDFEQAGYLYTFTDITATENYAEDTKAHQESLTFEAQTNQFDAVLAMTPKQKEVTTADGYSGTLDLVTESIKTEPAGYGTKSKRYTVTRSYPHLAAADTSYVPKTITDRGKTLSLTDIKWQTDNTATVDGYDLANRYTAVASYTGTSTSQYVKGYTVTAEYSGTVSKVINDTMHYEVMYVGSRIKQSINWQYPIALLVVLCLSSLGYLVIRNKKIREEYNDDENDDNPNKTSGTQTHGQETLLANPDETERRECEHEQAKATDEQQTKPQGNGRRHVYGDDDDTVYPGVSQ